MLKGRSALGRNDHPIKTNTNTLVTDIQRLLKGSDMAFYRNYYILLQSGAWHFKYHFYRSFIYIQLCSKLPCISCCRHVGVETNWLPTLNSADGLHIKPSYRIKLFSPQYCRHQRFLYSTSLLQSNDCNPLQSGFQFPQFQHSISALS